MATTMVLAAGLGSAAVATLTRSRSPRSPRSKHHRPASAQEESDDATSGTTAYSSWIEDDSPGLTSPCLSFRLSRDEDDNDEVGDDRLSRMPSSRHSLDDDDDRPSRLPSSCYSLLCYSRTVSEGEDAEDDGSASLRRQMSFCSSCSDEDVVDAPSEPHPAAVSRGDFGEFAMASLLAGDDAFLELVERARRMLQKESEHEIDDYFHQGDPPSPTGVGDSTSPVDAGCRSKMMEWSFRVLEYSFPHTPSPTSPRKHSVEAIQTVSQAFNLVDRLSTLRFRQSGGRAMNRSEYKLICMICLHLVAKTCGLFRLYDSERETEEGRLPSCREAEDRQRMMWEEESDGALSRTPSSQGDEGQTIVPTPALSGTMPSDLPENISIDDDEGTRHAKPARRSGRARRTRPPLDLLSLSAFCTLCQNEFSLDRLIRAERNALESLDWELAGATAVDWHRLLIELLALARGRAIEEDVVVYGAGRDERRNAGDMIAEVGERSLADLEAAMEANRTAAPSASARTAVARALDECDVGGRVTRRAISIYNAMVRNLMSPSFGEG